MSDHDKTVQWSTLAIQVINQWGARSITQIPTAQLAQQDRWIISSCRDLLKSIADQDNPELLKEINRRLGLTILLITHEMDVVKTICDKVAIIHAGQLIEQGEVAWFFAHAQTQLARDFIQSTIHLPIPEDYQLRLATERQADNWPLLRLGFTGQSVDTPLISEVSRRFGVDVSILSADIEYAGGVKFGYLLAELFAPAEACELTIAFLRQHQIQVEVLGYVRSHD